MKKYFKDLDTDTKIDIILNNNKLYEGLGYEYYNYNMELQLEEGELMLGDSRNNGVEFVDYYNSFYLALNDWHKFLNSLDADYLCEEGIELYKSTMELVKELENLDNWSDDYEDRYNELDEELEYNCKKLLGICEKQLHDYENCDKDDFVEWLKFGFEENKLLDDYYIIDGDTNKVYNDVSYTETFE